MKPSKEDLAKKLAQKNAEALDYRRRLRETELSRSYRVTLFAAQAARNPLRLFTRAGELKSLLKKSEVPTLPARMPSAEDFLSGEESSSGPPGFEKYSTIMRYPHIKVAVIGEVEWLSSVCHAYSIESAPWEYLLEVGTEALVINPRQKNYDKALASAAIKKFKVAGLPIIFWVHEPQDINNHLFKQATHIFAQTVEKVSIPSSKRNIQLAPSIDIEEWNPVDWSIHPSNDIFVPDGRVGDSRENVLSSSATVVDSAKYSSEDDYIIDCLRTLALGSPLLTSGSPSLKKVLGKGFVYTEKDGWPQKIDPLRKPFARERESIFWRRKVMQDHSHLARFEQLIDFLKIPRRPREKISIIHSTSRPDYLEHAIANIKSQTYPNIELLLILHGSGFNIKKVKKVLSSCDFPIEVIQRPKTSLFGDNLNIAVDKAVGELVTKMDDDDWYGPEHLEDLYLAYSYSGADIVGKWGNFVYLQNSNRMISFATQREEKYVHQLPGATILASKEMLQKVRFGRVKRAIDSELHRRLAMRGGRLYSTHRYNFIRVRHDNHTYEREDDAFLASADGKPWENLDTKNTFI